MPEGTCSAPECDRQIKAKGLCRKHWDQMRRWGEFRNNRLYGTVTERLANKIQVSADGCWLWTGTLLWSGYGQINVDGRMRLVHRVSYEMHVGPIPEGLQLDHLCRVRKCANPAHLEPVTPLENVRRGYWGTRTECINGHEFTPDNTKIRMRNGTPRRVCRQCTRDSTRRVRVRKNQTAK